MRRFEGKVVCITGGAKGIGRCMAQRFREEGAVIEIIDKDPCVTSAAMPMAMGRVTSPSFDASSINSWFIGDVAVKDDLERFATMVTERHGHVDVLINNALPLMKGIDDCSWEDFVYAQKVGVAAPFYLAKLFKDYFREGSSIVNISSTRDRMSQPQTESYTAAKGGIASLTHALAVSLGPRVRVNSISPGWINTTDIVYEGADAWQHPAGRVGNVNDIASLAMFLCSAEAGFITGENITVDGGMTHMMIYHGDNSWSLDR